MTSEGGLRGRPAEEEAVDDAAASAMEEVEEDCGGTDRTEKIIMMSSCPAPLSGPHSPFGSVCPCPLCA